MQKLSKYLGIRAVRLGLMAVFVATFMGAPALGYYTQNKTLQKLDPTDFLANVFLAQEENFEASIDTDGDGVEDTADFCPTEWGDDGTGCPSFVDSDWDGVEDQHDACPNEWGDDGTGCSSFVDSDGDGVEDQHDACPNEAGNPSTNGCPDADQDGDGVIDQYDMCPTEYGADEYGPTGDGCPPEGGDGDGDVGDQCWVEDYGNGEFCDVCSDSTGAQWTEGCWTEGGDIDSDSNHYVYIDEFYYDGVALAVEVCGVTSGFDIEFEVGDNGSVGQDHLGGMSLNDDCETVFSDIANYNLPEGWNGNVTVRLFNENGEEVEEWTNWMDLGGDDDDHGDDDRDDDDHDGDDDRGDDDRDDDDHDGDGQGDYECVDEDRGDQTCEVCTYEDGRTEEWCSYNDDYWDQVCGWDGQSYDSEEAAESAGVEVDYFGPCSEVGDRELEDMEEAIEEMFDQWVPLDGVIEWAEDMLKPFDQTIEDLDQYIELAEEGRVQETDLFIELIQGKQGEIESYKAELETHIADLKSYQDKLIGDFQTELRARLSAIEAGERGSSYFWNFMGNQDFLWMIDWVMNYHNNVFEYHHYYEMTTSEAVRIWYEAADQGVLSQIDNTGVDELKAAIADLRGDYLSIIDAMDNDVRYPAEEALTVDWSWEERDEYREELQDIIEFDYEKRELDDFYDYEDRFWREEAWQYMEGMWDQLNNVREIGFALSDLEYFLREDLPRYEEATTLAMDLMLEDEVQNAGDQILDFIADATAEANNVIASASDPEEIWDFFEWMEDEMRDRDIDEEVEVLADWYYGKYIDQMDHEDQEVIAILFDGHVNHDMRDTFVQEYGDDFGDINLEALMEQIKDEVIAQVITSLTGDSNSNQALQQISFYVDGDGLKPYMQAVTYVQDDQVLNDYYDLKVDLMEKIAELEAKLAELEQKNSELEALLAEIMQFKPYGQEAEAFMTEIQGLDPEDVDVDELKARYEEVKDATLTAKADDGVIPFTDVDEDTWQVVYVAPLKNADVISGKEDEDGNVIGYDSSGKVLNQETVKMITLAIGLEGESGTAGNADVQDKWSEQYYVALEHYASQKGLSLEILGADPKAETDRCLVAKTLNRVLGNESVEMTAGQWSDMDDNSCANDAATIAETGIMIGADDGNFYPEKTLNRAEMAAVVYRTMDNQGLLGTVEVDELYEAAEDIDGGNEGDNVWGPGISLLKILDALMPIF